MRWAAICHSAKRLERVIPQVYPVTAWFFAEVPARRSLVAEKDSHQCIFAEVHQVFSGRPACFTRERVGCAGAACYLGYRKPAKKAGYFLALREGLKKSEALGNAYYREVDYPEVSAPCINWQALADIQSDTKIEVVNLWVKAAELASLVTLANYDRPDNNNVNIPFASGCQSLWSLPYLQKGVAQPRCTVGCMDPVVRKYLAADTLAFSMPASRLVEMADNIESSFLGSRDSARGR